MWIIVKTKSGRERKRQMYLWRWTTVFSLYLLLPYMSRIKVSPTSPTTKQLYCLFFCSRANRTLSSCHYFHNGCKWRLYSCHLVLKIIYYLFNFIFFFIFNLVWQGTMILDALHRLGGLLSAGGVKMRHRYMLYRCIFRERPAEENLLILNVSGRAYMP